MRSSSLVRSRAIAQNPLREPEDGGKPPVNRDVNEASKNIVMMLLAAIDHHGREKIKVSVACSNHVSLPAFGLIAL
jgi:hypothetical protein